MNFLINKRIAVSPMPPIARSAFLLTAACLLICAAMSSNAFSQAQESGSKYRRPNLTHSQPRSPRGRIVYTNAQSLAPHCDVDILVNGVALAKELRNGHYFVTAKPETDYSIRFTCLPATARCMAVCYVDGLSVITQKPRRTHDPGYVIEHGAAVIPGYWLCKGKYAAFHFADKKYSLASDMNHTEKVGFISTVFYREEEPSRPEFHGGLPKYPMRKPLYLPGDSLSGSFNRGASAAKRSRMQAASPTTTTIEPEYQHTIGTELGHEIKVTEQRSSSFKRGAKIAEVVIEYVSAKSKPEARH